VREHAPGTAAAHHVEDAIEDGSLAVARRSPEEFWARDQGFDVFPFGVGEIARIGFSDGHPKLSTPSGQKSTAIISGMTYLLDAL